MKKPIFRGCATAIITPFVADGLDLDAFKRLIDSQTEAGINALVVCGTTGEASTMTQAEKAITIQTAVQQVNGRIPVIAGTGSNSTATAVQQSIEAQQLGADAILVVTPYYNKATQRGLVKHFRAIADAVTIPLILYNVPSRTGLSCTAETYRELSAHPNIIGVKEASGNFALIRKTKELCPDDFYIWSGNDDDTAAIMLLGGQGVISVVSNVAPKEMIQLTDHCLNGRFTKAGLQQLHMQQLCDALFIEVNPIPVKNALHMQGLCSDIVRLPLCEMSSENRNRLEQVLRSYSLL